MPPILRFSLCLMLLASCASEASATQVTRLDTRTMAQTSSDIVIGKVTGTQARWNDAHTKIVTDVQVEVAEALKGGATTTLTLTQLGGEVDGARYSVPGCPAFRSGEEVLLFVCRRSGTRAGEWAGAGQVRDRARRQDRRGHGAALVAGTRGA